MLFVTRSHIAVAQVWVSYSNICKCGTGVTKTTHGVLTEHIEVNIHGCDDSKILLEQQLE